ncbi:MAG: hypothetical protein ACREA0_26690, partial [bacterium]
MKDVLPHMGQRVVLLNHPTTLDREVGGGIWTLRWKDWVPCGRRGFRLTGGSARCCQRMILFRGCSGGLP